MNCRACGTQLPLGATNCPRCGTASSYYYSTTEVGPDDPTVVSSPDTVVQPLPPPPSPLRPRKRIGVIVGIVLLVLLLIGGGMFAWLRFSIASSTFPANGTFTILNTATISTQQNGQNTIYSLTQQGVNKGDLSGSFTDEETSTSYPDSTSTFSGKEACTCTVDGKSGTLTFSFTGTGTADGSFKGQVFDFQGTGALANLHGQGAFQGQGSNGTYQATYSDQLHFDG